MAPHPILSDKLTQIVLSAIVLFLTVASGIGLFLRFRARGEDRVRGTTNLVARIAAWWVMVLLLVAALAAGPVGVILLFAIASFIGLREMLPVRRVPRAVAWWMLPAVAAQYWLAWRGSASGFILIVPLCVPIYIWLIRVLSRDEWDERNAYFSLIVCAWGISHTAAVASLTDRDEVASLKLVIWLLIVVEMSDVLQYCWGKLFGRHRVVPRVSPNKTWEGLIGGVLSASALGMLLHALTSFSILQSGVVALITTLAGFLGGLIMSATKRRAGVKDYGRILVGHGGVMDRLDSLALAAPVFFYIVRLLSTL